MFLAPPEMDDWLILAQHDFEESIRQAIQKAVEKSLNSHFLKQWTNVQQDYLYSV